MNLAEIPLFSMLRGRLGYLGERQKIIAQNVANADTARYTPEDLKPFSFDAKMEQQKKLQMSAAGGASMMTATQAGHMTPPHQRRGLGAPYKSVKSADSETTLNGNGVVLEEQMLKMTDARMNYDAAISFYQKSMGLLRMAARPPGR